MSMPSDNRNTSTQNNSTALRTDTGVSNFRGYQTWYQVTHPEGETESSPLVILHGGPGLAHNYMATVTDIAHTGRPVILYDQIGCGNSTHLPDAPADFWNVELFVDELHNLVNTLGLVDEGGFHLLGQSWGGMLASEYVLAHPAGVRSLTLANSPASMDLWVKSTNLLRSRLPADVQGILTLHENAGTTEHPDYLRAVDAFYRRFFCRLDPWPRGVEESFAQMDADPTVYQTMIGPSEFYITGSLQGWNVVDRLHQVNLPTLVLAGEHDEAQPFAWEPFVQRIRGAQHHVFPATSHTPHLEARADFTRLVTNFLRTSERNSA